MKRKLHATVIRTCLSATLLGLWFGFALASSLTEQFTPPLAAEDLIEAYERGDLSFEELQEVLELLDHHSDSDQELLSEAQKALANWTQPSMPRPSSNSGQRNWLKLQHQVYGTLRGHLAARESVRISTGRGARSLKLELGRNGFSEWHARRALIRWTQGRVSVNLGSLHPVWTGGLLIGTAPRFMVAPSGFVGSLLQPKLARLIGTEVQIGFRKISVDVLYSRRADSLLHHTASGMRVRFRSGAFTISPAVMKQHLVHAQSSAGFKALYTGVSGKYGSARESVQGDIAFADGGIAFQSIWTGKDRDHVAWRLEYWNIPETFRNPLMSGLAQPDRELVAYPEILHVLSSTSTGESGGELGLDLGSDRTLTQIRGAWWRERSYRQNSVRASVTIHRPIFIGHLKFGYSIRGRPDPIGMETRHKGQIRLQGEHFWSSASVQTTGAARLRSTIKGGQLRCGYESLDKGLGAIKVSASLDVYDFERKGFVTIRYAQLFRQAGQAMSMYLRWRSPYKTSPALLSVRVKTEISL